MAYGKTIVSSNYAEPSHVLKNGKTGFLVNNQPKAFAEKILSLKNQKEEINEISAAVKKDFEENYLN